MRTEVDYKASYMKLESVPFSEANFPLATSDGNYYFFDESDLSEYFDEHEDCNAEDLMLVEAEPNYMRQVDDEYWQQSMPTDDNGESIPDEVRLALEVLNKEIRELVKKERPISYSPGKVRVEGTTSDFYMAFYGSES